MSNIYINGISSISPQEETIFFSEEVLNYSENILPAVDQDYKSVIKPMMLRRMSKAVKMGIFCAKKSLQEAGIENPDAVIVGTGQGCMQDTERFMQAMHENEEELLTPTSFIQSTHNTVSGQIALNLKCTGYNMTYTQNSVSFESALLDAQMQLQNSEGISNILVGAVDETSNVFTGFQKLDGQIKSEKIDSSQLLESDTSGTIISEAAAFFCISNLKTEKSYAAIKDLQIFNEIEKSELTEIIESFLKNNQLKSEDIDTVILGVNGDNRFDEFYSVLQKGMFSNTAQTGFKHLVGENNSISSYAGYLGARILKEKKIPQIFKLNAIPCDNPRRILIYNQYLGKNHGLILMESVDL